MRGIVLKQFEAFAFVLKPFFEELLKLF